MGPWGGPPLQTVNYGKKLKTWDPHRKAAHKLLPFVTHGLAPVREKASKHVYSDLDLNPLFDPVRTWRDPLRVTYLLRFAVEV